MTITRGFGVSVDTKTGAARKWTMGTDGVRRWADTGERVDALTLPNDVARCAGVGSHAEGWRDGCEDCMRRLAQPPKRRRAVNMAPPPMIEIVCPSHIPAPQLAQRQETE